MEDKKKRLVKLLEKAKKEVGDAYERNTNALLDLEKELKKYIDEKQIDKGVH